GPRRMGDDCRRHPVAAHQVRPADERTRARRRPRAPRNPSRIGMNTKKPTHICVFCGANVGARPVYAEAARALGRQFASNGITLVYGGGGIGLMFEAARAA